MKYLQSESQISLFQLHNHRWYSLRNTIVYPAIITTAKMVQMIMLLTVAKRNALLSEEKSLNQRTSRTIINRRCYTTVEKCFGDSIRVTILWMIQNKLERNSKELMTMEIQTWIIIITTTISIYIQKRVLLRINKFKKIINRINNIIISITTTARIVLEAI